MQQLRQGTLLRGGTYKIVSVLGQGSFGITYLAEHTSLERKVAIKEFFMKELNSRGEDGSITGMTDGSLSYNYAQKFKKEALNLSRLDHPNIVRVTDSFEENGTYYYVMDYIEGQNLNDYIKGYASTEKEAIEIIHSVAEALRYMHEEKHMLHLDLKPGNIMRRASDGHIFLIDFGLSKHYDTNGAPETSTTIGLGTPGYAPIEQGNQAKSGEFRPTIDVYALGATMFKLLTGETPPLASELISDDELLVSRLKAHEVGNELISIVTSAMLLNAKKRTQTVKDLMDALDSEGETTIMDTTQQYTQLASSHNTNESSEETVVMDNPKEDYSDFDEASYVVAEEFRTRPAATNKAAGGGDCEAMLAYGIMCLRGQGVKQNKDVAYAWITRLKMAGDKRGEILIAQWEHLLAKYLSETKTEETEKHSEGVTDEHRIQSPISNAEFDKQGKGCVLYTLLVVGLLALIWGFGIAFMKEEPNIQQVENATIVLTRGHESKRNYVYSGAINEIGVPDGLGTAQYPETKSSSSSTFTGLFVDGIPSDGVMTFSTGEKYKGKFDTEGNYTNGTYWDKDGYYFIGIFRNGQPYNGEWYDPQGNTDSKVINGI